VKKSLHVLIVAIAYLLTSSLAIHSASASTYICSPSTGNHCYGIADWSVGGNGANGGSVILQTNCMHVDDINTDFITNELWVDNDISHTYWTEAGVYVGTGSSGGIFNTTAPQYYWADKRPNGLYVEHDSGTGYTYGSQTTARVSAVPFHANRYRINQQ
jgi:hypothetical protein